MYTNEKVLHYTYINNYDFLTCNILHAHKESTSKETNTRTLYIVWVNIKNMDNIYTLYFLG